MLNLTDEYKLIPTDAQRETFHHWLEICPKVYNYALRQRKDWVNSRKCINSRKCRVRGTQWYVVITIESDVSVPDAPVHGRAIGIDLGLEQFLTASDGSFQERPKFFKLMQRSWARKQKGSQNWEKPQIEVARLHHRIANRRKDFHLKTADKLCDQAQTLFAEDLNVIGLTRGMLRKHCVDAAFGQFLSVREWVCSYRWG